MAWVDDDGVFRSGTNHGWHVLAVGVGGFPGLTATSASLDRLSSPGPSVRAFQQWVLEQRAGFASLVARVAPAPGQVVPDVATFGGTTGEVAELVDAWLARVDASSANGGWLYLCTHGVRVDDADYAICADVDLLAPLDGAIDLTSSLRRLRHGPANRLFCCLDVCRTELGEIADAATVGAARVLGGPARSPRLQHALTFWATRKRTPADGQLDAPSVFVEALLDGLRGLGAERWPPGFAVTPARLARALDHRLGGRATWDPDGLDGTDYAMVPLDEPPRCDAVFMGGNVQGAEVEATALGRPDVLPVHFTAEAETRHELPIGPWQVQVAGGQEIFVSLLTPQSRVDLGRFGVSGLLIDPRDPNAPVVHVRAWRADRDDEVVLDQWVSAGVPLHLPQGLGPLRLLLDAAARLVLLVDVQGSDCLLVDAIAGVVSVVGPDELPGIRSESDEAPLFETLVEVGDAAEGMLPVDLDPGPEGMRADRLAMGDPERLGRIVDELASLPAGPGGLRGDPAWEELRRQATQPPPFRASTAEGSRWTRSIADHPTLVVPDEHPHLIEIDADGVTLTVPLLPGDRLEVVKASPRWRIRPVNPTERSVLERWVATGQVEVRDRPEAGEPVAVSMLWALGRGQPDHIPASLADEADGLLCRAILSADPEARALLDRWDDLVDPSRYTPALAPILVRALARAERLSHPAAARLDALETSRSLGSGRVVLVRTWRHR